MMALGHRRDEADALVAGLASSGEQFGTVQDALAAAYRRPQVAKQPASERPESSAQPEQPERDWVKGLVEGVEGANRHVLVEGQSGSGKSLMTKHIAFERMAQGEEVNVVDMHTPEAWGGAKQVFQGERAGTEAADFFKASLTQRKEQASEAKTRGEVPDFKPMTIVLSDFARLMKDSPQLREEFRTLMTEARKFRISIVADTTALTSAATGIKGIQDVLQNFGQRVKLYAPTPEGEGRRAEVGGKTYQTPQLPTYEERTDFSLVKPTAPSANTPKPIEQPKTAAFDPFEEARKRREGERRRALTEDAYRQQYGERDEQPQSILGAIASSLLSSVIDLSGVKAERAKQEKEQSLLREAREAGGQIAPPVVQPELPTTPPLAREQPAEQRVELTKPAVTAAERAVQPDAIVALDRHTAGMDKFARQLSEERRRPLVSREVPSAPPPAPVPVAAAPSIPAPAAQTPPPLPPAKPESDVPAAKQPTPPINSAAPPNVNMALAIDEAVKGAVKGTISGIGGFAQTASSPNDDPGRTLSNLSGAVSAFGEKIPVLGTAIVGLGEAGKVLGGLMQNLSQMADKYGEYNPQIAQAQAMAEIRRIMGDMRRAQESGSELARFVQAQSEMQQKFEDIKMKIWMKILPVLTAILEAIGRLLGVVVDQNNEDVQDPTEVLMNVGLQVQGLA